jgi:hypothetical protein
MPSVHEVQEWFLTPLGLVVVGALGGMLEEVFSFVRAVRRSGSAPWKVKGEAPALWLAISAALYISGGAVLGSLLFIFDQVTTTFQVFAVGAAAPTVFQSVLRTVAPSSAKGQDRANEGADKGAVDAAEG